MVNGCQTITGHERKTALFFADEGVSMVKPDENGLLYRIADPKGGIEQFIPLNDAARDLLETRPSFAVLNSINI